MLFLVDGITATGAGAFHPGHEATEVSSQDSDEDPLSPPLATSECMAYESSPSQSNRESVSQVCLCL